jgi:hypothetical protein
LCNDKCCSYNSYNCYNCDAYICDDCCDVKTYYVNPTPNTIWCNNCLCQNY